MLCPKNLIKRASVLLILLIISAFNGYGQGITVESFNPYDNTIVGEDMYVGVIITSTYEISDVEAVVNGNTIQLTSVGNSAFEGTLSLIGVPQGVQTLQITATDVFDNTGTQNIIIIFDTKPEINVVLPLDHSVARPELVFDFDGTDIENDLPVSLSYKVEIYDDNGNLIYSLSSGSAILQVVDFSFFLNREMRMFLSVTDARGQTTSVTRQVYVDTSETLIEEYTVENEIMDFDGNNLLFVERNDVFHNSQLKYGLKAVSKVDMNTNLVTDIPLSTIIPLQGNGAFKLLDQAVIFSGNDFEYLSRGHRFIWNTNSTTQIGYTGIPDYDDENHIVQLPTNPIVGDDLMFSLYVCEYIEISPGTYLQVCQPHYFLQEVADPLNVSFLDGFHGEEDYDSIEKRVDNNNILYYDDEGNIVLLNNGIKEYITTDGITDELKNRDVMSDGTSYVYVKDLDGDYFSTVLFDGTEEIELREVGEDYLYDAYYKINNGYIAFNKKGNLGQELIMLRKPTGETVIAAPFGTNSYIEALNELGEIIFATDNNRYLYTGDGDLFQISNNNTLGSPYYYNDQWYIAMGNTLFSIDTSVILPVTNHDLTNHEQVVIYPNPATNEINVKLDYTSTNEKLPYTIVNIMGQEVLNGDISGQSTDSNKLDLSGLNTGVYFLNISVSDNSITKKIIKK
ncbi:T9SS type A sorting domain-containing protein [Ulvibacter antarcticus]|uniref:Putative secreted protein (Por secretion system target) n=1 Tax=Ulvibacter antarcticus TaxID=442714 RepID=A0A3L9YWZ1_9FLAO|nr:T9SS type A sorting domain-containing protein [Ulvibacter antarcticus]RMA64320.1 putative secreted protein (Por secretion system target) [Ulvibacter antarcticus]